MFGCFGLLLLIPWLWILIDCYRNEPRTDYSRIPWLIVIVLGQILGAALYVLIRRPQRIAMYGH